MNEGGTEHNPLDFAGQESTEAKNAEEARLQRERDADDLRYVLGSKQGRRFVWRLLGEAGIFKSTFNENHALASFAEGQRNRGLALLDEILTASPNSYPQMVAEQNSLRDRNEQRKRTRT